ncbi:MAG: MFS transporter, partial [Chloroflexi bacterium]|nr:MFS transporter [Chloroflexota bacterium]
MIVRSALVEAVVLAGVAASREPWQLAGSFIGMGLSLGNTGVMLAVVRETAPRDRLGTILATIGAAGFLGSALGPVLAGLIVDLLGLTLTHVYAISSGLMVGVSLLLILLMPEVRPEKPVTASPVRIALDSLRGAAADPATRRLFTLFGVAFLGSMMTGAYLPLLVERANGPDRLVSAIAAVTGTAALVGGALSPFAGYVGDRVGFRPVLAGTMILSGAALLVLPLIASVAGLVVAAAAFSLCHASSRAMIFGLLSIEVPAP